MSAAGWSAFFTAIAALAAVVYVELTRRLWLESARQREANLMLMLMVEYDNLRDSIAFIRDWYIECASSGPADPLQRFRDEFGVDYGSEHGHALDSHRFRVSRFFVRTRKLVQAGYLAESLVASALGGEAIEEVFLKMVDPLDSAKADHNYGAADQVFYSELLKKYPRPKQTSPTPDRIS